MLTYIKDILIDTLITHLNVKEKFWNDAHIENETELLQYINELGEILLNSEIDKILIGDKEISYTSKQMINYQNQELELCVDWERDEILLAGVYQLNIIIDNRISGRTAFRLK